MLVIVIIRNNSPIDQTGEFKEKRAGRGQNMGTFLRAGASEGTRKRKAENVDPESESKERLVRCPLMLGD